MNYSLILESSNRKTGPMPVTYQHRGTCPDTCAFKGTKGCSAETGYVRMHWDKVDKGVRGTNWATFIYHLASIPYDIWRWAVAGDIPHRNGVINKRKLNALIKANNGRPVIAFTHHDHLKGDNMYQIWRAYKNGFPINKSFEQAKDAVAYTKRYSLPAVTTMPLDSPKSQVIDGVRVVMCPATKDNDITCKTCKLCSRPERKCVVGFYPIGKRKKTVDLIARG